MVRGRNLESGTASRTYERRFMRSEEQIKEMLDKTREKMDWLDKQEFFAQVYGAVRQSGCRYGGSYVGSWDVGHFGN